MLGTGIRGAGILATALQGPGPLGLPPLDFAAGAFTAGLAKRATTTFAASPLVQGKWDGTGTPDVLSLSRGTLIGNPTGFLYTNFDPYQGSIAFWITPEWAGNDGVLHAIFSGADGSSVRIYKSDTNRIYMRAFGTSLMSVDVSGWAVGARHFVVCRWDFKNTLDGTNYCAVSVDDVHTYGATTLPTITTLTSTLGVGSYNSTYGADAVIEGLTVYRRPLWDGAYGKDLGNGDEINLMHAAGAGADPCLITGSWDVVFCLPTNSATGSLVTGTGCAWSHPHESMVLTKSMFSDGGYLGAAAAVAYNGTTTTGNAGSGATLDDLPAGGNIIQIEAWIRYDATTALYREIIHKTNTPTQTTGWVVDVNSADRIYFNVNLATTDATATGLAARTVRDGKWHHIACHYNDTTKVSQVAVDGSWGIAGGVGVGAYVSDAANSLHIGSTGGNGIFLGAIGWVRIHNHAHYTPGTDFVPPRAFPGADAGTVECWSMADGTGNTAVASVTSPANDCALTNHTWERTWNLQGTPVVPTSLQFDGAATYVNCGSGVTLDDLPAGGNVITIDGWVRVSVINGTIAEKGAIGSHRGWYIAAGGSGLLNLQIQLATTDVSISSGATIIDNRWHHIAAWYDDTAKRGRVARDGVWSALSGLGVGAYQSDAGDNLNIGRRTAANLYLNGNVGWFRISNNDRFGGTAGTTFVPPARTNPPAVDGNTVEQWNFTTGAGTTEPALVTTPANDGAITMGSGRWWNAPGMEWENPGGRVYNWGYGLGCDAADEGVIQTLTGLTAGANYVARIPVNPGAGSSGQAKIVVYDETNGAAISTFLGPQYTGLHTGANNSATLIAAAGNFPQSLVGATLYNITDGSSTVITAISGDKTTCTGVLAGGTDNDWDTNDVYRIVWSQGYPNHPWCETFCWELPTVARNGVAADCTSMSIRLLNALAVGTLYWHQAEVQAARDDGPSLDTGAGNPWIADGWTNSGLDAGDTEQEAVILHSGASSIEWNAGAVAGESMYSTLVTVVGSFYGVGFWSYGDGTHAIDLTTDAARALLHYSTAAVTRAGNVGAYWLHRAGVYRALNVTTYLYQAAGDGAGDRFTDDVYVIPLTNVSLTSTPATQPNSLETAGLRIDGYDLCTQTIPAGYFGATWGWTRWRWTPRHAAADLVKYGNTGPTLLHAWGDANNYIRVYATAANNIRLEFNDGGGVHTANWNCAGAIAAGTTYVFEVRYVASVMWLIVNGVQVATITTPITFATVPATLYWSSQQPGGEQADAVYAAP